MVNPHCGDLCEEVRTWTGCRSCLTFIDGFLILKVLTSARPQRWYEDYVFYKSKKLLLGTWVVFDLPRDGETHATSAAFSWELSTTFCVHLKQAIISLLYYWVPSYSLKENWWSFGQGWQEVYRYDIQHRNLGSKCSNVTGSDGGLAWAKKGAVQWDRVMFSDQAGIWSLISGDWDELCFAKENVKAFYFLGRCCCLLHEMLDGRKNSLWWKVLIPSKTRGVPWNGVKYFWEKHGMYHIFSLCLNATS